MGTVNCVILGNSGVGKTTFIKRCATGEFQEEYIPTTETIKTILEFQGDSELVQFHVYDGCSSDNYPENVDCAIILCDFTNSKTSDVMKHYEAIHAFCGKPIPIVICGNKADDIYANYGDWYKLVRKFPHEVANCAISTKENRGTNIKKPFTILMHLLGFSTTVMNCVVLGNPGVGKTTFLKKCKTGTFIERYTPTTDTIWTPLEFRTAEGPVYFHMFDGKEYPKNVDCAIIVYDRDNLNETDIITHYSALCKYTGKWTPTVTCLNKSDLCHNSEKYRKLEFIFYEKRIQYCDISTKSNVNLKSPFILLMQQLGMCSIILEDSPN